MCRHRASNQILTHISSENLKEKAKLPYNGSVITNNKFSFSFACFDRTHKLFNLGGNEDGKTVGSQWFLDLLDCFKSVSNINKYDLKKSIHELHRINWKNTNVSMPESNEQLEYWQFRLNKSRGRVIGFIIDNIFYVVWLDRHHNLTNSEGYGKEQKFKQPLSEYEGLVQENKRLNDLIKVYEEQLNNL